MPTEMSMKETGSSARPWVMAGISTLMGNATKDIGSTTNNTALVLKHGQTGQHTKVNTDSGINTDRANSSGPMGEHTKAVLSITTCKE